MGLKLGRGLWGRNAGWGCLITGCWGGYLVLGGTRGQGSGGNYIMRSWMVCTPHPILFGWSNREEWDGRECTAYGGEERDVQGFGGETWRKRPLGRPRRRWETNIKMDLRKKDVGVCTGSSWLWIGTGGRLLYMRGSVKCREFVD